jgi:hypothetical protein
VFQHARELASAADVNPVVVLSAALLLDLARDEESGAAIALSETAGNCAVSSRCQDVLSLARLDEQAIAAISALLDDFRSRRNDESAEVVVLRDAVTLADLTADHPTDDRVLESQLQDRLRTDAARAWARSLFQPTD